tara:strand:+ start:269 stop:430 length:162 start_codon:yes stop_codon:yes gene_type:complete
VAGILRQFAERSATQFIATKPSFYLATSAALSWHKNGGRSSALMNISEEVLVL